MYVNAESCSNSGLIHSRGIFGLTRAEFNTGNPGAYMLQYVYVAVAVHTLYTRFTKSWKAYKIYWNLRSQSIGQNKG